MQSDRRSYIIEELLYDCRNKAREDELDALWQHGCVTEVLTFESVQKIEAVVWTKQQELASLSTEELELLYGALLVRLERDRKVQLMLYQLDEYIVKKWLSYEYWTREEATAILASMDPDCAKIDIARSIEDYYIFDDYFHIWEAIGRSQATGRLDAEITPVKLLEWAAEREIPIPELLQNALARRGLLEGWDDPEEIRKQNILFRETIRRLREDIKVLETRMSPDSEEDEIIKLSATHVRTSVYVCLIGMAIDKFNYDRSGQKTDTVRLIMDAVHRSGLQISDKTVTKRLKEGLRILEGKGRFNQYKVSDRN